MTIILDLSHCFVQQMFTIVCLIIIAFTHRSFGDMESTVDASTPVRYCDVETFRAVCSQQEVIRVHSAIYGRKSTGRCLEPKMVIDALKQDSRYYGCYADVLHLADRKCSGRKECIIRLPDPDFEHVTPCYEDSRKYLEIAYSCVKVVESDRSCNVHVSTTPVHISSLSEQSGCGSTGQPWTLRAPTGQQIRLHLVDFSNVHSETRPAAVDDRGQSPCVQYGHVTETATRQSVICGHVAREQIIYKSAGNVVNVVLSPGNDTRVNNFLIRFYATGCLDMKPPPDAWFRRSGDTVEVGCYLSRHVWVLRCVDNEYVGVLGNCSQYLNSEVRSEPVQQVLTDDVNLMNVLLLVAVCGAGLAVCLTVICIGVFCIRRGSRKSENTLKSAHELPVTDSTRLTGGYNDILTSNGHSAQCEVDRWTTSRDLHFIVADN